MRCLIEAAEHDGIVMMAEIAMRRALSHGELKPEPRTAQEMSRAAVAASASRRETRTIEVVTST